MGFYGSVAYMAEAGMTNAKKPLGQRGLANKWRLTCIWWRRLILYLSLGLGCMVVSASQMISEQGALSANVKVMAEEPLEWSRF